MSNKLERMIAVTAPSGAGKSTIVRHLIKKLHNLSFSISATTRKIRPKEKEGVHYYFKTIPEFKSLIEQEAFVEWEEVYEEQYYGTLKSEVSRIWEQGKNVIFDIDVHGATDIKNLYKDQVLTVFVKPPSFEVLIERLLKRDTENEKSIKKRIQRIRKELKFESKFDYVLLNDKLDVALNESEHVVNKFLNKEKKS